jgi:hypothetical protein
MLKHIVLLLIASVAVVMFMSHTQQLVQLLLDAHAWVLELLSGIFSGGQAGNLIKGLIALLSLPLAIGLIPTLVYWMIKRHAFPYFMEIVWIVWLVQAGALVMMAGTSTV